MLVQKHKFSYAIVSPVFFSLILLYFFRYQLLYTILPFLAKDDVFGKLSSQELKYINFYSPEFSFKVLSGGTAGDLILTEYRDGNTMMLTNFGCDHKTIFDNVDPKSFKFTRLSQYPWHAYYGYATDKSNAFYFDCSNIVRIDDVTVKNLKEFDNSAHYATDGEKTLFNGAIMSDVDTQTFSVVAVNNHYSYDKNSVYFGIHKLTRMSPVTVSFLGKLNNYITDGTYIYYHEVPINNADLKSFTVLDSYNAWEEYATDAKAVYYLGNRLEHANPTTFRVVANFPAITTYSTDGENVYFKGAQIQGADALSFRVAIDPASAFNANDKFHRYKDGVIVN